MLTKNFSALSDGCSSFGEIDSSNQPLPYCLPILLVCLFQLWISASLFMVIHVSLLKKHSLSLCVQYPV